MDDHNPEHRAEEQNTIVGALTARGGSTSWSGTAHSQPCWQQDTPDTGTAGRESPGSPTTREEPADRLGKE